MSPRQVRLALALASGADGVHLAGRPAPGAAKSVRQAFRSRGRDAIISVPCHNLEDIEVAREEQVDLLLFSPVFEKLSAQPQGLEALRRACETADGIPVFALGGVTPLQCPGLPCRRRRRRRRHSTLCHGRLAAAEKHCMALPSHPANSAYGTIYSEIRRNHAECPFEKVLDLSSIGRSTWSRQYPYFLGAFLIAVSMLPWAAACHAQDTQDRADCARNQREVRCRHRPGYIR